jgi:hypothetical protein
VPEQLEPIRVTEVGTAEVELVGDTGGRVDPEELARRGVRHEQDTALSHDPVQVDARGLEHVAADRQERRRRGRRERAMRSQRDYDCGKPEHIRWARDFYGAVEPHAGGRVYVNLLGDEGEERVRAAYGEEKYERLRALKGRYDPSNVFRLNQNIRP